MWCESLDNWIGIRGCGSEVPGSGIYINDYPGITTYLASHVADSEDVQGITLLQNCIERAYSMVMSDIIGHVSKFGHFWSGQEVTYGATTKLTDTQFAAGQYSEIELIVGGPYERIRLDKILIYSTGIGNATITVTGVAPVVTVHALVAGLNTIVFANVYENDTTIRVSTDVAVYGYRMANDCECICGGPTNNFAMFVSQYCDLCAIAYQYRESLTTAFYLRAAIEFWQECIATPNMSQEARKAGDLAAKSLVRLLGGQDKVTGVYFNSEYSKALKILGTQFNSEISHGKIACFVCEQNQIIYQHP